MVRAIAKLSVHSSSIVDSNCDPIGTDQDLVSNKDVFDVYSELD